MFKFLSALLDRMGIWFGVIFKFILPVFAMYRPIKAFALSVTIFSMEVGGSAQSMNSLGIICFYLVYAVLVIMLILLPKVASAMEFVLIFSYFAFLGILYFVDYFSSQIADADGIIHTYSKALPLVLIFLAGKIFFYFFIKKNKSQIETELKYS